MTTRRKVSFGNPALGTTHIGWVNTVPVPVEGDDNDNDMNGRSNRQMVAMVDVPPEEVPEGVLNLARSHRPYIEHVRIFITSPENTNANQDLQKDSDTSLTNLGTATEIMNHHHQHRNATSLENAASIFALEEEKELQQQQQQQQKDKRSFLILFSLLDSKSAHDFVRDLHGKPYTTLEPDITCSVHMIDRLEGISATSIFSSSISKLETNAADDHTKIITHNCLHQNAMDDNEKDESLPWETSNCAVCLEKMEFPTLSTDTKNNHTHNNHTMQQKQHGGDAIITTVCNHSFHVDCLLGWQDSPCPVCRYDGGLTNEEALLSKCHVCGTTENNYICLICGVVSCNNNTSSSLPSSSNSFAASASSPPPSSSYPTSSSIADNTCTSASEAPTCGTSPSTISPNINQNSHASQHYKDTLHAYALDTQTQHVWDFCGQGYVHRLLQNSQDGKLVEVHDPSNTTSHVRSSLPRYLSDAQEGLMVHAKLEGFANQYYNLLKSQLEAQRIFYEERLQAIEQERNNSKKKRNDSNTISSSTAKFIIALKQEKHQLEQRCLTLRRKYQHNSREVIDLKSMNESLEAGKEQARRQIMDAQRDRSEAKKMFSQCLPPLEEKISSLIMQLELESGDEDINQQQKNYSNGSENSISNDDSRKPAAW